MLFLISGSFSGFRCCDDLRQRFRPCGFHFRPFRAFCAAGVVLLGFYGSGPVLGLFRRSPYVLSFNILPAAFCCQVASCFCCVFWPVSGVFCRLWPVVPAAAFRAVLGLFALLCYRSRVRGFCRSSVRRSFGGCSSGAGLCVRAFAAAFS